MECQEQQQYKELEMLDEQFYYHENSLDILLKFSTHSEDPNEHQDFFDYIAKDQQLTQLSIELPPLDLLEEHHLLALPNTHTQLAQMQQACLRQEAKMKLLLKVPLCSGREALPPLKRDLSECTQASNSPARKTKRIKKEKL